MTLAKFHNYTKAKVFEFRRLQTLQTASISVPYQVDPEFIIINCDNAHTRCYLYAVGPDAYNGIRSHRACTRISWLRLINSWIRELQLQRNTIYESFIYALICVSYHRRRIGVILSICMDLRFQCSPTFKLRTCFYQNIGPFPYLNTTFNVQDVDRNFNYE